MRLPREVRLEVYRILLQSSRDSYCYPQILATCQKIHNEAMHLLYSLNIVKMVIMPSQIYIGLVTLYELGRTGAQLTWTGFPRAEDTVLESP